MHKLMRLTLAIALMAGAGSAISQNQAAIDLQAAIRIESVDGDLEAAIEMYRRLAESSDGAIAAEALLHMGGAYEKLGRQEARQAYERVIAEFLDQTEQARVARQRLARLPLDTQPETGGTSLVAVLNEDLVGTADRYSHEFSPDGSQIVFVGDWREDALRRGPLARNSMRNIDILVADRSGTLIRPLLRDWGEFEEFLSPYEDGVSAISNIDNLRWSPDGRRIAFTARRPSDEALRQSRLEDSVHAIFVVDAEGGSPQQIGPSMHPDLDISAEAFFDLWWNSDSDALGFITHEGIFQLSLTGKINQIAEMALGRNTEVAGYSTDGRWIAFTVGNQQLGNVLYVISAQGGRAVRQAQTMSTGHGFAEGHGPTWTNDGTGLYVPSDIAGTTNIWRYGIDPGTGQPSGEPIQVTSYVDAVTLAPRALKAGEGLAYTLEQTRTTINVADVADPTRFSTIARGSSPRLSSDGRTIYYLGQGSGQNGIYAIDRDGSKRRRLSEHVVETGPFGEGFELSPDDRLLVYRVLDGDDRHLYTLDTQTGENRRIFTFARESDAGVGFFSPDGESIAFSEDDALYRVPANGGAPERIASLWRWYSSFIRWSPDGRRIAALGWESPEIDENSVYLVSASGGEPRRLRALTGDQGAYLEGLEWHPDGRRLSYFDYEIVRTRFLDLDGNVSDPIFDHREGWEYLGHWRPDGRHYVFESSLEGNNWQNFEFDLQTGEISPGPRVDDASAANSAPGFSADGSTMVWTSGKELRQIWLLTSVE